MPLVVDSDAKRRQVAAVVADIIATSGLDAVTVRSVAVAAGFSTSVVSHYFSGKRELLLYSYRMASERSYARIEAALHGSSGDPERMLASELPFNPEARRDWLVWVVFWAQAVSDPEFAALQREQYALARRRFEEILRGWMPAAQARNADSVRLKAETLLSTVIGLSMQAAFEPDLWPERRQRAVLGLALGERAATSKVARRDGKVRQRKR